MSSDLLLGRYCQSWNIISNGLDDYQVLDGILFLVGNTFSPDQLMNESGFSLKDGIGQTI